MQDSISLLEYIRKTPAIMNSVRSGCGVDVGV